MYSQEICAHESKILQLSVAHGPVFKHKTVLLVMAPEPALPAQFHLPFQFDTDPL